MPLQNMDDLSADEVNQLIEEQIARAQEITAHQEQIDSNGVENMIGAMLSLSAIEFLIDKHPGNNGLMYLRDLAKRVPVTHPVSRDGRHPRAYQGD